MPPGAGEGRAPGRRLRVRLLPVGGRVLGGVSLLFLGLEAVEAPPDQVPLIESLPWALNYSRFIK